MVDRDWPKLIHNLRASFETDLLSGQYGRFALTTIAEWLGHSVKVMLEHYGRIQQSDFDQIAQACLQVQQKKNQTMGIAEAHLVPFLTQSEGYTIENISSNPSGKASLNASLYTAAQGGVSLNETESPSMTNSRNPLQSRHLTAIKGKGRSLAQTSHFTQTDGEGLLFLHPGRRIVSSFCPAR